MLELPLDDEDISEIIFSYLEGEEGSENALLLLQKTVMAMIISISKDEIERVRKGEKYADIEAE